MRLLRHRSALAFGLALLLSGKAGGQELIYQEGFNSDGEAATPPRYTTLGREVYEVARIRSELGLQDQLGPIYWAHSTNVSFVGVPGATAGRRALMAWHHNLEGTAVNTNVLGLFQSTAVWLMRGKTSGTVLFSPAPAGPGDQVLFDHLAAAGYTVITDDDGTGPVPAADLVIKSSSSDFGNASRFATVAIPVLTYRALDHDDLLVSSIGQSGVTFEPGDVMMVATNHPAAGGKRGSFPLATGAQTFDLIGDILPVNSTVLANFTRNVPPTIANLAEVDAAIAGTLATAKTTNTLTSADFSLASATSPGKWLDDAEAPGSPSGAFALVGRGRINVQTPGRYTFALGVDDGGRLRIDRDRNGFGTNDNVIVMDSTGAFREQFADVNFTSAGIYDFEWVTFNTGGASGSEVSVTTSPGGGATGPVDAFTGEWDLLGSAFPASPVQLQGPINVVVYVPNGPVEQQVLPFIVLINGPDEGGSVFGGGPFSGFEGAGFFAGSGLNKWPYPNDLTYRSLTLRPVDVTGKTNVQVTVALAATFLDFETSDFLDILADPDAGGPREPVTLAHFAAPNDASKYFTDGRTRLGLTFQDATYPAPTNSTQLVIEFRAATTWWNEIVAFDNVRITSGAPVATTPTVALVRDATGLRVEFVGVLQSAPSVNGPYTDIPGNPTSPYTLTITPESGALFLRARNP